MSTERPILFNGEMVKAILDGRKVQTRRLLKPQPQHEGNRWVYDVKNGGAWQDTIKSPVAILHCCPFGAPGDHLWVRETFAYYPDEKHVIYAAREGDELTAGGTNLKRCWKPSIHMPRWASRITLEITEVRVQRVQEITVDDAAAEGTEAGPCAGCSHSNAGCLHPKANPPRCEVFMLGYKTEFQKLWDSCGYGWEANPWVWAITFKRIKP